MVHKIEKKEERGNVFQEGLRGWAWLFGKLRGKKKEEPIQNNQQSQPQ